MAIGFTICSDCKERYFTSDGHKCKKKKAAKKSEPKLLPVEITRAPLPLAVSIAADESGDDVDLTRSGKPVSVVQDDGICPACGQKVVPPPMSNAERQRRYRARLAEDKDG